MYGSGGGPNPGDADLDIEDLNSPTLANLPPLEQFVNMNIRGQDNNNSMNVVGRDDDLSYTDIVNTNEDEEDD